MDTNDPRARRKLLLLAALIGLAVGRHVGRAFARHSIGPAQRSRLQQPARRSSDGPFSLRRGGRNARHRTRLSPASHALVYFGFTNCPDRRSPSGLQVTLRAALDASAPRSRSMTAAVHHRRSRARHAQGDWRLCEELQSAHRRAERLAGRGRRSDEGLPRLREQGAEREGAGSLRGGSRSSFMYLMNGSGEFAKHFLHTVDADQLADEMARVVNNAQSFSQLANFPIISWARISACSALREDQVCSCISGQAPRISRRSGCRE